MVKDNEITTGKCSYCERPSVRIIKHPPLIPFSSLLNVQEDDIEPGKYVKGELIGDPGLTDWLIMPDGYVTHWEAREGVCWQCWDGAIWPKMRAQVVNLPPEMKWDDNNPWRTPKWESIGRESQPKQSAWDNLSGRAIEERPELWEKMANE